MKRILGIDTGTNSLGWAVIDRDEDGACRLIKKGSYIFQEGVKIEKGNESSKSSERSDHRSLRRQYFRRRLRKIEVLKVLIDLGWCPYLSAEVLHLWHTKKQYPMDEAFMAWQRTDEKYDKNPYAYRYICLHDELDLDSEAGRYILGRAIYHLAQRRGFLSNRLEQNDKDDKEIGAVKQGISKLSEEMAEAGCDYLGDYFYKLFSERGNTVRIRSRYTDREAHYQKEFVAICERQHLSPATVKALERALYFQRPLKSQRFSVGKCVFEAKRKKARCADSHPMFERYRMLSFVNNIRVKRPQDTELRPLNEEERQKAYNLFYRKSKPKFDFEDIAKAIAGRGHYQHIGDAPDPDSHYYQFNCHMTQTVCGCPTTAALRSIFGEDYQRAIAEQYLMGGNKSPEQMVDDVWNVLYSFTSDEHLKTWAKERLQLDEEQALQFSKIRLSRSFASLSLAAIRLILPWLERGLPYAHAVFMAKIPAIVGDAVWAARHDTIEAHIAEIIYRYNQEKNHRDCHVEPIDKQIKQYLQDNYDIAPGAVDMLYHPSRNDIYPDVQAESQDIYQLGSPMTNAVRNPMAMRSLHQVRKVVNLLLRQRVIDQHTEVHIEYARELNDANKRKAIAQWNKDREKKRSEIAGHIKKEFEGLNFEPTADDLLKYELWEEQGHHCLYTGREIGIEDFIGPNPRFDIEHTIPRSLGGDSTMENLTLCDSQYNREVKKAQIPSQFPNYEEVLTRIEKWKEKISKLQKELAQNKRKTFSGMAKESKDPIIQKRHRLRMELDYWQGKYNRFTMAEVPEGFSRRQGAGIGLVSRYAGLYLSSLFHEPGERRRSNVYTVKGTTTAEFRKIWGIQNEYDKKSRNNHIHHCIDATVIACIQPRDHAILANYYRQLEAYEWHQRNKPTFDKPWPTFTEDLKKLADEVLVVHNMPDNMPKHASMRVKTAKGVFLAKGDSARGSLHNDTYYGAIEREGKIRYVVRKPLSSLEKMSDVENIVDETVKEIVKQAIASKGLKEALAGDIYMNKEKGILIKKVRCYANNVNNPINLKQQRDLSVKDYKQSYHVANDGNYLMAIYEGQIKGKTKRDYELVKTIEAARYFKKSTDRQDYPSLIPEQSPKGLPLKHRLKIGQLVLLYENSPEEINFEDKADLVKRLYKITGLSYLNVGNSYGRIVMRYHQEARCDKDIKTTNGIYKNEQEYRPSILLYHTQFNALVEGEDFELNALGEIIPKR